MCFTCVLHVFYIHLTCVLHIKRIYWFHTSGKRFDIKKSVKYHAYKIVFKQSNWHPPEKRNLMKKTILCAAIALVFSGCQSAPKKVVSEEIPLTPIESRLAVAAESISDAFAKLATVESVANRGDKTSITNTPIVGMERNVTVKWTGPVKQLLTKAIEFSDGYTLEVRGKEPSVPIIVDVDVKSKPLFVLVRDAAYQAGLRAKVIVDNSNPDDKKVILEYAL